RPLACGCRGRAAAAVLVDRRTGGPYKSFKEARKRLAITPHDLAALARAGCLDFTGRGREALLAEAKLAAAGRPADARERPEPAPPWPLGSAGAAIRAARWEMLGFATGPPLMLEARRSLPVGVADVRGLRAASHRERLALAGLVAGIEGDSLVLIDEHGAADAAFASATMLCTRRWRPSVFRGLGRLPASVRPHGEGHVGTQEETRDRIRPGTTGSFQPF